MASSNIHGSNLCGSKAGARVTPLTKLQQLKHRRLSRVFSCCFFHDDPRTYLVTYPQKLKVQSLVHALRMTDGGNN